MENNNWKLIRLANEKYLKIPPQVSDYLAVQDILRLCSYGLSNKTIANRLDMDVDYITDTLMHYIEFSGWVQDMDFNPYYIYQRSNKSFGKYNKDLEAFLPIEHVWETSLASYFVCKLYDEILTVLDNYYKKDEESYE